MTMLNIKTPLCHVTGDCQSPSVVTVKATLHPRFRELLVKMTRGHLLALSIENMLAAGGHVVAWRQLLGEDTDSQIIRAISGSANKEVGVAMMYLLSYALSKEEEGGVFKIPAGVVRQAGIDLCAIESAIVWNMLLDAQLRSYDSFSEEERTKMSMERVLRETFAPCVCGPVLGREARLSVMGGRTNPITIPAGGEAIALLALAHYSMDHYDALEESLTPTERTKLRILMGLERRQVTFCEVKEVVGSSSVLFTPSMATLDWSETELLNMLSHLLSARKYLTDLPDKYEFYAFGGFWVWQHILPIPVLADLRDPLVTFSLMDNTPTELLYHLGSKNLLEIAQWLCSHDAYELPNAVDSPVTGLSRLANKDLEGDELRLARVLKMGAALA